MIFKDIAKHLPVRLHAGEMASIDRVLERLGKELSASHHTHASDQRWQSCHCPSLLGRDH
jgi:hypothetical protein